jgi:hypothetical protein
MRYVTAGVAIVALSALCGLGAGVLLRLGERAYAAGVVYLVLLAIPSNLAVAAAIYTSVRAGAATVGAGVLLTTALSLVSLVVVLGVAAWSSGLVGSGADTVGAHGFTWGMGYAYLQAIRDVPRGAWFGETRND